METCSKAAEFTGLGFLILPTFLIVRPPVYLCCSWQPGFLVNRLQLYAADRVIYVALESLDEGNLSYVIPSILLSVAWLHNVIYWER